MRYWTVHYPDGTTKKHANAKEGYSLPGLDKVFYLDGRFDLDGYHFQIVEMSEEDIWVEAISKLQYREVIHNGNNTMDNFAYFHMMDQLCVVDFKED